MGRSLTRQASPRASISPPRVRHILGQQSALSRRGSLRVSQGCPAIWQNLNLLIKIAFSGASFLWSHQVIYRDCARVPLPNTLGAHLAAAPTFQWRARRLRRPALSAHIGCLIKLHGRCAIRCAHTSLVERSNDADTISQSSQAGHLPRSAAVPPAVGALGRLRPQACTVQPRAWRRAIRANLSGRASASAQCKQNGPASKFAHRLPARRMRQAGSRPTTHASGSTPRPRIC